ncbi:MAG: class I SAM-dependent RNA methyltransferase [Chloroflexi bacterium]|nr:class I SAM-dependent RNA methyltransferase [Chloroflexota bacterium]
MGHHNQRRQRGGRPQASGPRVRGGADHQRADALRRENSPVERDEFGADLPGDTGDAASAPATGEPVRLTITGMAYGGEAVGRAADGTVVFVWGALPDEDVLVDITDRRKRFWRGRVREILTVSPDRVEAPCPIFRVCGGCQWQDLAYPAQVAAKQAILLDQARPAFATVDEVMLPALAMVDPWRYRNTAHFTGDAEGNPAFRRWLSHDVVAVEACPVTQEPINSALPAYRGTVSPGERLSLRCSADGAQMQAWRADDKPSRGERTLTEEVLGTRYQVSPRSFFQINTRRELRPPLGGGRSTVAATTEPTSLTEDMVRLVLDSTLEYSDQTVIDAYCGVGLFALPIATRAPRVIGIEESDVAVLDAIANAQAAGLTNMLFLRGGAGTMLPAIAEPVSAVVLDPPRTGVDEAALRSIIDRAIPRVVYVSCNPATLGRDLHWLAGGGYRLDSLRLIDLFPHTLHIEAIAVLTMRGD